jgi:hypothetical protein
MSEADPFIEQLRAKARTFLEQVDSDPDATLVGADQDDEQAFLALPPEDRMTLAENIEDFLTNVEVEKGPRRLESLERAFGLTMVPWVWSAEEWQSNPAVERLTSPLPGDGPELQRPSSPGADPTKAGESTEGRVWTVRGADEYAANKWKVVAAKLPACLVPVYDRLVAGDPNSKGLENWQLCGQIGTVEIGDRVLGHSEVRCQTAIRRGRRTKKDISRYATIPLGSGFLIAQGQARVLYALDESTATVWITDAHLFKVTPGFEWVSAS